jgi:lambda family phage minor tail protein L
MTSALPDIRQLDAGTMVRLYQVDLTALNDGVPLIAYLCNYQNTDRSSVSFGGHEYTPIACIEDGFEWSNQGTQPTPSFTVSNINSFMTPLMFQYNDLLGAKFTRILTFEKYLDGRPQADSSAKFQESFLIDRKAAHTNVSIVFELKTNLEYGQIKLPKDQVLRSCSHTYRRWNGSSFNYTGITCDYTGPACFTKNTIPTNAANDNCGKQLKDCKARFGDNAELPFGGFPNVKRT